MNQDPDPHHWCWWIISFVILRIDQYCLCRRTLRRDRLCFRSRRRRICGRHHYSAGNILCVKKLKKSASFAWKSANFLFDSPQSFAWKSVNSWIWEVWWVSIFILVSCKKKHTVGCVIFNFFLISTTFDRFRISYVPRINNIYFFSMSAKNDKIGS